MKHNEKTMRDEKVPIFNDINNLLKYIEDLSKGKHDYGTCCYAMSMASVATFNFVANKLGVTGFQASIADMDIIRRTRNLDCPFIILKAEEMLYPQYNLQQQLSDAIEEWDNWAIEKAKKLLSEKNLENVHPDVLNHWKMLAKKIPPSE